MTRPPNGRKGRPGGRQPSSENHFNGNQRSHEHKTSRHTRQARPRRRRSHRKVDQGVPPVSAGLVTLEMLATAERFDRQLELVREHWAAVRALWLGTPDPLRVARLGPRTRHLGRTPPLCRGLKPQRNLWRTSPRPTT